MKKLKNKNGVTLIALAVTIIVMLILAGVTISTLTGNSGITTKASKAKTKSYLANIKEEYELYLSEKRMDDEYDLDTLYANDKTIRYEGNEVGTGIAEICSSIKKGDEKKFEIIKGKIYYVSQDKNVIPIAVELGFSINPYEITDSGVLKSSSMNLYLVDNDGHLDLSEYEGKIKTIEAGAFSKVEIESGINPLQSIVLPKGITTIGDDAFSYNTSLTSIKIPNTVTSIGKRAFQGCTNLTSIEIPDTVTYIGDYCFSGCNRLQKIKLSKKIQTINQRLLQGCSSLTEIEIPKGVKSIGYAAFSSCSKLTTITLPASLTSLSGAAIARLNRLTEIKIADGNNSFKVASDNNTITAGNGKNNIGISGSGNTLTSGNSSGTVNINGDNNDVTLLDGKNNIVINGNSNTYTGGKDVDTIKISGDNNYAEGGGADDKFTVVKGHNNTVDGNDGTRNTLRDYGVDTTYSNIMKIINQPFELNIKVDIGSGDDKYISTSLNLELYDFSVDLTTPDSARTALDMIDEMLSNVSSQLVNIGAAINRLEFVLNEQNIKIENMISTRSTLRDADVAKESANYIRYQILQQAGATLMSATRNLNAQNVLGLIGQL